MNSSKTSSYGKKSSSYGKRKKTHSSKRPKRAAKKTTTKRKSYKTYKKRSTPKRFFPFSFGHGGDNGDKDNINFDTFYAANGSFLDPRMIGIMKYSPTLK